MSRSSDGSLWGLFLLLLCPLTFCGGPELGGAESPAAGERSMAEEHVIGPEPTTIEITAGPDLRTALEEAAGAGSQSSLPIRIEGVKPPTRAALGVRVFLNHPGADRNTSLEDAHYLGSFTFFPSSGDAQPQDFLLDAAPALRRLEAAGEFSPEAPVKLTLIAVSLEAEEVPQGELRVTFQGISLGPQR